MTSTQFKAKWLGKRVDYDGVAAFQCVDLIKQYVDEVFGIKAGGWGNAITYWTNTKHPLVIDYGFKRVTGTPQAGDIVVIDTGNNIGHIGIATDATHMLEQNGGAIGTTGLGADAIRIRTIAPLKIAGLLRKGEPMPTKAEVVEVFKRLGKTPTTAQINLYTNKPWSVLMKNVQFTYGTRLDARDKKISELRSQLDNRVYVPVTEQLFKKK